MQADVIDIAPKDYAIIGKLHVKNNPEEARRLIDGYRQEQSKTLDSDIHNLNFYFLNFCNYNSYLATDYIGNIKKRDKTDARKLFIAAMMRIFHPQLFAYDLNLKCGLAESLCIILQVDAGCMTKIMEEVRVYYNHDWQGFHENVNNLAQKLIGIKNGYSSNLFDREAAA